MTILVCSYFKKTHSYDHRDMFLHQKNIFWVKLIDLFKTLLFSTCSPVKLEF